MKVKRTIVIAGPVLAILVILALAAYRGKVSRELILKRNGVPLANMKADILPALQGLAYGQEFPAVPPHAGTAVVRTSTDLNGRLDLSVLPEWTDMIAFTLRDGAVTVFSGDIMLPTGGSRTVDFLGNRTITTTTRTYADFILFKLTGREVIDERRSFP